MKKTLLLMAALTAYVASQAQWVNDPFNNNFIANTSTDAGEIYLSTDPVSGDTYLQWSSMDSNGWSPTLQRLNFNGNPQWGNNGIHISGQNCASWSQGMAMTATTDGGVVSCFSTDTDQSVAVRINADGTFPWGEQGIVLFGGMGGSRTELLAGNDGGVWALGTDITNSYLQYVNPNGTLNPMITISDNNGASCTFGQMVPAANNGVFVVYEKEQWAYTYFYSKELWVRGFNIDGTPFSDDEQLMSEVTMGGSYIHYVVPDGEGGGYAFLWHPGVFDAFNVYVFHFNANGLTTIFDLSGVPVHEADPYNFYLGAYGTVDPVSHDLLIVYEQTDVDTQSTCKIWMNRITSSGEKVWGDGLLVYDSGLASCGGYRIDAFEYGDGFSVIYHKGFDPSGYQSTVEAKGFDMSGNALWSTTMCSSAYAKTGDQNSTGFHSGQNIVAWVNANAGGLYAQNIGQDGSMGLIVPPIPPEPCPAPGDFDGKYYYSDGVFGVSFNWIAPETTPLQYHLYREDLVSGELSTIVVAPDKTEYFDEVGIGDYRYQLTAVYEDCESNPAMTVTGEYFIWVEVTSVEENTIEEIVTVTNVYTMNGQQLRNVRLEDLSHGVYIIQGLTASGKLVSRKVLVD